MEKAEERGMAAVGLQDLGPWTGYMGSYARMAAENDTIFLGCTNSPSMLIPHGSIESLWGTNPLTVSIPAPDIPVVLDMASSKVTFGDAYNAREEGERLPEKVALDADGKPTRDPAKALEGGLVPIAGPKGSGLAFIVELLAGALTRSPIGESEDGERGAFYTVINPDTFQPVAEYKERVQREIDKLKNARKADGVDEIRYPGERSQRRLRRAQERGTVEIADNVYEYLTG